MTDLAARMRLHLPGQLTWPEPTLRRRCGDCAHIQATNRGATKGRCYLVEAMHKTKGVAFDLGGAIACPKFKERVR